MFDHIVSFADEDAAKADPVAGAFWIPDEETGGGAWRGDAVIPRLSVYRVTGTETVTPPEGEGEPYDREIRQPLPGWFLVISLTALSPELRDLPGCMLIADRDAADRGEPFIVYLASSFDPADLETTQAEPLFAGTDYPFHLRELRRR